MPVGMVFTSGVVECGGGSSALRLAVVPVAWSTPMASIVLAFGLVVMTGE